MLRVVQYYAPAILHLIFRVRKRSLHGQITNQGPYTRYTTQCNLVPRASIMSNDNSSFQWYCNAGTEATHGCNSFMI